MIRTPATALGFRLRLPVHVEPLNRLRELGRGDRQVVRGRGELAQRGDLLLRRGRRLLGALGRRLGDPRDRKSTRLNSSHSQISYAVFCLKKKKNKKRDETESTG